MSWATPDEENEAQYESIKYTSVNPLARSSFDTSPIVDMPYETLRGGIRAGVRDDYGALCEVARLESGMLVVASRDVKMQSVAVYEWCAPESLRCKPPRLPLAGTA